MKVSSMKMSKTGTIYFVLALVINIGLFYGAFYFKRLKKEYGESESDYRFKKNSSWFFLIPALVVFSINIRNIVYSITDKKNHFMFSEIGEFLVLYFGTPLISYMLIYLYLSTQEILRRN